MKLWITLSTFIFFAMTAIAFAAPEAAPKHCLTLYGECKYPANFQHFDYVNPNAPKGGTVKLAETGTFDNLNPFILKGVKAPGMDGVFESLMVQSQDEPMSMYGLVAETVSVAPDNSLAQFTLRKEARWQDGTPITPDDVVFSFNALKTKGDPSYKIMYAPIGGCVKTGERSVTFTFNDTTNRQLPLLAAAMPIVSKAYYTAHDSTKLPSIRRWAAGRIKSRASIPAAPSPTSWWSITGARIWQSTRARIISTASVTTCTAMKT